MNDDYLDIIGLDGPPETNHPKMTPMARAAQFAPFAALVGFDDMVKESEVRVTEKRELDSGVREEVERRLQVIFDTLDDKREVTITYFVPDGKKEGGKYITARGFIDYIDESDRIIVMENKEVIPFDDIYDVDSDIFSD